MESTENNDPLTQVDRFLDDPTVVNQPYWFTKWKGNLGLCLQGLKALIYQAQHPKANVPTQVFRILGRS